MIFEPDPSAEEEASQRDAAEEGVRFVIAEDENAGAGKRLDAFLTSRIRGVSRVRVRRSIDEGAALVDGKPRKASYRLRAGETVEFVLGSTPPDGPQPEAIELSVLFEDEAIAVVDKPAGMVVHPAKGHWSGTLASALAYHFDQLSTVGGAVRPGIVHRLDRETSGVLVVAKTDEAHRRLADQFKARTVRKEYLALVLGSPDRDRDMIDHPIGDHPKHRERKALRAGHTSSREAQTFYEVEERFTGIALVRAKPKTGRTHQIRLHLTHAGFPVLGDKIYGGRTRLTVGELRTLCRDKRLATDLPDDEVLLDRQALHAHRIGFAHPTTGELVDFETPLPADFERLLRILREGREE